MSKRLFALIVLSLAGFAAVAFAESQLGSACSVTPFQATASTQVSMEGGGNGRFRISIPLGSQSSRIDFLSIRYHNIQTGDSKTDDTAVMFNSAQATFTLSGRAITHGIESPSALDQLILKHEADISRAYTFYADASTSVVLDVEIWFGIGTASVGELSGTVVGRSATAGCGFGN